jgi:hypothetical protein
VTEKGKQEKEKALFANLVMMLSTSAMQYMGKLTNPLTDKTETDLQSAQVVIDMLAMLKERTAGNLEESETHMLDDVLSSLQLNYVETKKEAAEKD